MFYSFQPSGKGEKHKPKKTFMLTEGISLFQVKIVPFRSTPSLLVTLWCSGSFLFILPSNFPLYRYRGELICPHGDGEGNLWVLAYLHCEGPRWAELVPGLGALYWWCPCSMPSHVWFLGSPAASIHHLSHILPVQNSHNLWLWDAFLPGLTVRRGQGGAWAMLVLHLSMLTTETLKGCLSKERESLCQVGLVWLPKCKCAEYLSCYQMSETPLLSRLCWP